MKIISILILSLFFYRLSAQNIGINTTTPLGALHVKSLNGTGSTIDQQQVDSDGSTGANTQWQSFTAGVTGLLTKIELSVGAPTFSGTAPGTIKIYNGEGIGGALLSTTAVTFQNPMEFKAFNLSTLVNVTAGNKYTIEFSTPTTDVGWATTNNNSPYTGGTTSFANLNANMDFLFKTYVSTTMTDALLVMEGKVGIGNTAPQAPLHVSGLSATTSPLFRRYFNVGTTLTTNSTASGDIQIQADGYFWANGGGFVATSDARIKNILGNTDNEKDLGILKKIEITNYTYKDNIHNNASLQKKVIAQQLKSVYPIAVSLHTDVIPSVFEIAKKVTNTGHTTTIETTAAHGFITGDLVKLILETGSEIQEKVMVIDANTFSISQVVAGKIFVYGKKVNDLHTVDYDALTTLNISATQALLKRIELLEKENLALKTDFQKQITALEAKFNAQTEAKEFSKIVSK